ALRLDRTAVERAEAAVVAGGPAVVGHAVHAGRRAVGVVAEALGGGRGERREEHVGAGRHRVRVGAPRGEGVGGVVPRNADRTLGLAVVGLHLVVVDRPVGDIGAVDRTELAGETKVDLAVARQLAV